MNNDHLNEIIKTENGWFCNVFEFDRINIGGIFLDNKEYEQIEVEPIPNCHYRYYRKTRKIVISSVFYSENKFCALDFEFKQWKCLICRKLCRRDQKCLCEPYSNCWSPMNVKIVGLIFSDVFEFNYLSDSEINII